MTLPIPRRHLAVLGLGFVLSVLAMLGAFGTYRGYRGQPLSQKIMVLFMLPVTATVVSAVVQNLRHRAPAIAGNNDSADAALEGIVFWVCVFLLSVHTLLVSVLFGMTWTAPWAMRAVVLLLGLTLAAVGNLLPRTRPNMAIGIRTARTLNDRQFWIFTHRLSGYVLVALGLITMASALFLQGQRVAGVPFTAFALGGIVLTACYVRYALVSGGARQV
jgi:uncharacterized membrane protein